MKVEYTANYRNICGCAHWGLQKKVCNHNGSIMLDKIIAEVGRCGLSSMPFEELYDHLSEQQRIFRNEGVRSRVEISIFNDSIEIDPKGRMLPFYRICKI